MISRDAGRAPALEAYLARLGTALAGLSHAERDEILLETRSHVADQTQRSPARSVDAVLSELGSPEAYARQFLPDDGPKRSVGLRGFAGLATGGWRTLPLLFVVVSSYAIALFLFLLAVSKVLEPDATGLFVDGVPGRRSVLFYWSHPDPPGRDVLGWSLVPLALLASVTIHLAMSKLMRRLLRTKNLTAVAFAVLTLGAGTRPASAQNLEGALYGVVRSGEDATPIAFALVRLVPQNDGTGAAQQVITGAAGHFRFARLHAGEYRLQLLRIGYRPVVSAALRVQAGEILQHDITGPTQALQLPAIVVRDQPTCLNGTQLADDPRLADLWNEAQKGVDTRRAFDLQYRYTLIRRSDGHLRRRFGGRKPLVRVDTIVNEPDSARVREERGIVQRRARGYGRGNLLVLPDERELLNDAFLRDHCLETDVESRDGALSLRFRPQQRRRDGIGIRGTIAVDASTYLIRGLEFEWIDGDRPIAEARVEYADVTIGESTLRLPSGGRASLYRISGVARATVTGADVTLAYAYSNFVAVGGQSDTPGNQGGSEWLP